MANEAYKIIVTIDGNNQASASIDKVNRDLGKMDDSVKKAGQSWDKFKTITGNVLGAAGLAAGVAAVVGQVNALGYAANAAEITFNQVSGGVDKATASLGRMRDLTGHVIDDMSLMQGANSLLVTGVASTSEQAEKLVNLGARLSSVMGVDAAEGIQNLNSALLNNSFLRLDTLGISASRVRERVNELKEAGLDMSAAFAQAVTEIGTQTLEDLGAAASVSETAIARLSTRLQNLGQDLAQGVNSNLEQAATTLEQIIMLGQIATGNDTGNAAIDAQIAKQEQLIALAEQYQTQYADRYMEQGYQFEDIGISSRDAESFLDANPSMASTVGSGSYFQDAFDSLDPARIAEARAALELLNPEMAALSDTQLRIYALELDTEFLALADAEAELARQTQVATEAADRQAQAASIVVGIYSQASDAIDQAAKNAAKMEESTAWMRSGATGFTVDKGVKADSGGSSAWSMGGMDVQTDVMSRYIALQEEAATGLALMTSHSEELNASFEKGAFVVGENPFFNANYLGEVSSQASALMAEYERLQAIQETNPELVSQESVDRAKEIADSAALMAQDAEAMALAWENASLAQIAGQTDGGREDEFNRTVLAGIEDPEQRAALEREMNMRSGVENENTDVLSYGTELVSAITSEQGTVAGANAAETFVTSFEEGILMGLEGADLKAYVEEQVGFRLDDTMGTGGGGGGGGGEEITIEAGEGYQAVAARTGYTVEELEAATGGRMLLAGEVITVGDGTTLVAVTGSPEDLAQDAYRAGERGDDTGGFDTTTGAQGNASLTADYTYYDPATGSYTYAEDGGGMGTGGTQGSLFPPEQTEAVSQAADDMLTIETSMTNISTLDTSSAMDGFNTDIELASQSIADVTSSLGTLVAADYSIELPISFVFNTQTAEVLSRNPQVLEVFRLVLPQVGVTSSE
jgi:hypothetical protein